MSDIVKVGKQGEQARPANSRTSDTRPVAPSPNLQRAEPLSRPERRRNRAKSDRGLAPVADILSLASVYHERQRKHWPEVAEFKSAATPDLLDAMAADFIARHRGERPDPRAVQRLGPAGFKKGGGYLRFSSDNSNWRSNEDQLSNCLDKAKSEHRFIPWNYVNADFAVTGTDSSRLGYQAFMAVLKDKEQHIETTYIDDFTRASRDDLEWWKIASDSKRLNKRMIGASDGFDLTSELAEMMIGIYGLISRLFLKGLREKVGRGMKSAARRGTSLGRLPLGFTRRPKCNANGEVELGGDGLPIHEICIDVVTAEYRALMFNLFVKEGWTVERIAKHFNELGVDGWKGWTPRAIRNLLFSPTAIGIFVWNQSHTVTDPETKKKVKVRNRRKDWVVYRNSDLAVVPVELWKAARRKLGSTRKRHPNTGKKATRNQISASTLFSGTLYCAHCGGELKLIRSMGKYKQLGCLNGTQGCHDCALSASKSVSIVEESLLAYVREKLLSQESAQQLVNRANELVAEEAAVPKIDTTPLKAQLHKLNAQIKRLVTRVSETDDSAASDAYDLRVKHLQKELRPLQARLREAEVATKRTVKPLTLKQALNYVTDLRTTLGQDVGPAAEALRLLLGPIKVRQQAIDGKQRHRWIATFTPNLPRAIRLASSESPCVQVPGEVAGAASEVEVVIDRIPKYESLAPKFRQLRDDGASVPTIANARRCKGSVLLQAVGSV